MAVEGVLRASTGSRPGELVNTPQCTGQAPRTEWSSPNISSAKDGNLGYRETGKEGDGRKRAEVTAYLCPSGVSHLRNSTATSVFFLMSTLRSWLGFPAGVSGPESASQCRRPRDASLIPRAGNGHPLQYSYLGNPMDTGAWQVTVHGVSKSWTQLNTLTY